MIEVKDKTFIEALDEIGITHDDLLSDYKTPIANNAKGIKPLLIIALVSATLTGAIALAVSTGSGLLRELIIASFLVMLLTIVRQMDVYGQPSKQ